MTNEELKKKIVEVVLNSEITGIQIRAITGGYSMANNIADALIAAGIGDLKEHRIFAGKDGSIKQLYSGEEVEQIAKERDEYKHRAEVVQLVAKRACDIVFSQELDSEDWDEVIFNYKKEKGIREIGITPNILYDYLKEQAEKQLAEEGKE